MRIPIAMRSRALPARQRGAALGVALVFLLVLTMLGVAAMSKSGSEQKMARNFQEHNRAFQAAETGIARVLNQFGTASSPFNAGQAATSLSITDIGAYQATADVGIGYLGATKPGALPQAWDTSNVAFHHFSVEGQGATTTKARSTVTQGVYLIGAPTGDVLYE